MKQSILKQITEPIKSDLGLYQAEFNSALQSDVKLINTVGKYIIERRGKRFRPILTILAAHLCGKPNINTYRSAAVIELLHIATLIHDDIVDDAEYRRKWPALNRVWKNKISLLMGDYVLSKSLIYMVKIRNYRVLDSIGFTAEALSSGELMQIEKSLNKNMTEDVYFSMIEKKTASLIATACELGAISVSENEYDISSLKTFGTNLGIAFQIKDDLFDLLSDKTEIGKDVAADFKSNMITLPLVYSMNNTDAKTKRKINKLLRVFKKNKAEITELINIIDKAGGFDYARNKIDEYSNKAIDSISEYPESIYKQKLIELVKLQWQS